MAVNLSVSTNSVLIDPKTGKLTRDGFVLFQSVADQVNVSASAGVTTNAAQTLTNKTMDGDANSFSDIPTTALKTLTGDGLRVVSSTGAGSSGDLARWDSDGNVVDGPTPPTGAIVGTSDTQTLSAKTLEGASFTDAPIFPVFTVLTLPDATLFENGVIIVSDETGGRTLATSDGSDWRRVSDGAVVT